MVNVSIAKGDENESMDWGNMYLLSSFNNFILGCARWIGIINICYIGVDFYWGKIDIPRLNETLQERS